MIGRHFSLFYVAGTAEGEPQRALGGGGGRTRPRWGRRRYKVLGHAIIDAIRDAQGNLIGFAKIPAI